MHYPTEIIFKPTRGGRIRIRGRKQGDGKVKE
jgi:hypothetical protein